MKIFITILACFFFLSGSGQSNSFPRYWEGDWKGELSWYQTGIEEARKINMELRIRPTDSINTWAWQIIYGSEEKDNRPYRLVMKDSVGVHWAIDEFNGIILDQYWVGNKFCGSFSVLESTIVNSYWIENDQLMVEFYSYATKPVATSGQGTKETPSVDSYRIGSYQKAVLHRIK